jgi:phosphatidate cytidylyltransferase
MLGKRLASTIVLVAVVVGAIFKEEVLGLTVTLFAVLGLFEFFTMLEKKGISIYKYFGIVVGAMIPLSITFRFELTKSWELLFIVLMLLFLIIMQLKRRESSGVITDISTTLFGILYICWFFSFLIKIRYLNDGLGLLAAVIIITKFSDIGAYLIGSRFGKHPLLPRISPKKSMEGAIGGLGFGVLGAFVCRPFLSFGYLQLLLAGVILSVLGQLGDLSESLIKRDCNVKDSGNLIPGIGGVLDLIDSLLFTAPAFYFYISIISPA